jgi:N-acetyltransferase
MPIFGQIFSAMSLNFFSEQHYWIPPQTQLSGRSVRLRTMQYDHIEQLAELGSDSRIWADFPADRTNPRKHAALLTDHLVEMKRGQQHVFFIQMLDDARIAGLTRVFNLNLKNRQLEIGSWLHPDFWRSGVNTEAKFLLLRYCFEELLTVRVQFRTDVNNARSRAALEKLGAKQEGIFRKERIREDGTTRDAVFYSILDMEWFGEVKPRLENKLAGEKKLELPLVSFLV